MSVHNPYYSIEQKSKVCNACKKKLLIKRFGMRKRVSGFAPLSKCKECALKASRKRYREHIEEYRKRGRDYSLSAKGKLAKKLYRSTEKAKELYRLASLRRAEKYPEKVKAVSKIAWEIRTGRLTRQPCEVCGNKQAQAHHDDYSKPYEIRWLCRTHHAEHHRKIGYHSGGVNHAISQ